LGKPLGVYIYVSVRPIPYDLCASVARDLAVMKPYLTKRARILWGNAFRSCSSPLTISKSRALPPYQSATYSRPTPTMTACFAKTAFAAFALFHAACLPSGAFAGKGGLFTTKTSKEPTNRPTPQTDRPTEKPSTRPTNKPVSS
jgi:hypothetical protein